MSAQINAVASDGQGGLQGLTKLADLLVVHLENRGEQGWVAQNAGEMLGERWVHLASPVDGNPGWAALEENNSNL